MRSVSARDEWYVSEVSDRMLPVRGIIEVTVDAEGSIRIEQFDPVEEMTFNAITLPHQDIHWLVEQLLDIMMVRKSIPDSEYN